MLRMTIAVGRYDRTAPLLDGRIRPEGLEITWLPLNVEQTFWRMFRHREFDGSELSTAGLLTRMGRGLNDFVPLPVFLSRTFRHDCIYVNANAGISRPEDLVGRRIGVPEFQITAAVWARGLLEDDYGVRQEDLEWVQGGLEQPGRRPFEPVQPPDTTITNAPPGRALAEMLATGEIDALISPRRPSTFGAADGPVRRLFPDVWATTRDYYARTRIFPIMHLFVVRREIYEANPWVAQTLTAAFTAAKKLADEDLLETAALAVGLPFLVEHAEATIDLMGRDFWPYGVEASRPTLEALVRYAHRQGLIPEPVDVDSLFPPSTLAVSRV
jgi:4,5-dihydroxyphthalate decarboxylase